MTPATVFSGFEHTHQVPRYSEACHHRQASRAVPSSRSSQRRPPEGAWDVWHHIQMYRYISPRRRPLHVQRRPLSSARLRGNERTLSASGDLWNSFCFPRASHHACADRDDNGTVARTWGRLWILRQVWSKTRRINRLRGDIKRPGSVLPEEDRPLCG